MPNKPQQVPVTKSFRKPYRHEERIDVLRGAGLPTDDKSVHPYRIDEGDSGIISGGFGTPTVRQAVLTGFTFAFEQCARYKIADPGRAFNRFPAFRETSFDVFEPVFTVAIEQSIPAPQAGRNLESADRMSRPELGKADAPGAQQEHCLPMMRPRRERTIPLTPQQREARNLWREHPTWSQLQVCEALDKRAERNLDLHPIWADFDSWVDAYRSIGGKVRKWLTDQKNAVKSE